jgi:hypothetical protein
MSMSPQQIDGLIVQCEPRSSAPSVPDSAVLRQVVNRVMQAVFELYGPAAVEKMKSAASRGGR